MKTSIMLTFFLFLSLTISGCTSETDPTPKLPFSIDGTVFTYGDQSYDLALQNESINAIMEYETIEDSIVLVCHTGPQNNIYAIFDTETETFTDELIGTNLIWHSDSLKTIVYAFWGDIYQWNGEMLGTIATQENSYIRDLAYSSDYSEVIVTYEVTSETETATYEETFSITE